ncbi:hypothetical protein P3X46_012857 [Hevea brasiliensis]|uniref:Importin subunit beta-1/Transportin-1-like TPR repeats domain-containing protein n=1 Tax=Hevea brasiliensis TaxID=3981 RepID=A0ABQ9ME88_HEVBR|nr:hypothetical protein P3X46_012857 [Hevea brasiliensis]
MSEETMSKQKECEDAIKDLLRKVMVALIFQGNLAFDKDNEDYAQMAFEELIEMTNERPDLLLPHVNEIFQCIYQVLDKPEFEEKTRFLAEELMELLLLHYRHAGQVVIQTGKFLGRIFSMLTAVDDDPEKYAQGVKRLARYAPVMGGQYILEKFSMMFEWHYFSQEWQCRHAAVISHSIIANNCRESIDKFDILVEQPIKAVDDTHFRVRWAAIGAIEEFSCYLNPEFQLQYYQKVLPALIKALNFSSHPCIQVQAASSLFYFIQHCTSDLLKPYTDEIIHKLLSCLQRGKQLLKEEALTAIASLASSSEDCFQPHYKTVMPYVKVAMMKASAESDHILLLKSIECMTMVGVAAGKEKFCDDIQMVVQLLISLQESKLEIEDPMRNQVLLAWGRLCKCLGPDFQPYLGVVIPHVLQSAKLGSHVTSLKHSESENSFQSIMPLSLGDESTERKQLVLEEIAKACKVLCLCATELKEGFDLWIDEVAHTLVPLLNFDLYEEVREVSILALPELLKSFKAAMEKGYVERYQELPFEELCSFIVTALVEALHKEPLMEIQIITLEAIEECMEISGPTLNTEQIKRFLHITMKILITSSNLSRNRVENKELEIFHNKASDCFITFTKAYKDSLSQFFDQLLSSMAYMWENDKSLEERRTALRIFSDVAQKCQEEALNYCKGRLQFLFDACYERKPEVLQIVAQGIGVSAEFGGSIFKSHMKEALGGLNSIMLRPETLRPDYLAAHDAAVSALGKIFLCHHEELNEVKVFGIWLSHLPIFNDLDQARVVHDQLCSMIEKFSELIVHKDSTHLSKIFAVFAEILRAGQNLASKETVNRIIEQLKHLQSNLPPDTWASIISSLVPSRAKVLQRKLST